MRTYHPDGTTPNIVFVFGSNLGGQHGAGAARVAYQNFGARGGDGMGRHGMSYAIPTKDRRLTTLSLEVIATYVADFIEYARVNPDLIFFVTAIGCGLAGYTAAEIAPMFKDAPDNCDFPDVWAKYLEPEG